MPARYTERQAPDRGAVAKYYQETETQPWTSCRNDPV